MAVHLPLSAEAQAEARILMLSSNNILSPAHGAPLATPSQDMVLGAYYLTYGPEGDALAKIDPSTHDPRPHVYRTAQEAEWSYEHGVVKLHDLAEYRPHGREGGHVLTTVGRILWNDRIERALVEALGDGFDPSTYEFVNRSMKKKDTTRLVDDLVQLYGAPTISQVLDAFKDVGFHFATQAGVTISKNDVQTPPTKPEILARYDAQLAVIEEQYENGEINQEERHEAVTALWDRATNEVGQALYDHLDELNPIYMMANSGARGSFSQIRQLAGMRGLMANPKGEIIERPIKASFQEGLTVLEYFISTHGARKGLADTALRTADSGYLTRRLVDVAQDVIIRSEDCGTEEYVEMPVSKLETGPDSRRLRPTGEPNDNLIGRIAAQDITTKRDRVIVEKGKEIDRAELADLVESWHDDTEKGNVITVPVRSVLKCEAPTGICQACYGRSLATGKMAQIGDAVGHHRRPVDRRAGHAADDADVPHRRRRRRGHHARPAARRRAVRGAQAEGSGQDRRGRRQGLDRGVRQGGHGRDHRRRAARSTATRSRAARGCSWTRARRSSRARSSTRARCTRPSCWPCAGGPRPRCTSSARSRRSTSPRASTSTTSTSS